MPLLNFWLRDLEDLVILPTFAAHAFKEYKECILPTFAAHAFKEYKECILPTFAAHAFKEYKE